MPCCPTCGHTISHVPPHFVNRLEALVLPRKERLLLDCLIERYPRWTPQWMLADAIYEADGEDEPDNPISIQQSHASKLRKKLVAAGFGLKSKRFGGKVLVLPEPAAIRRAA